MVKIDQLACETIAEKVGDEVFARFEPDTQQLVDIELAIAYY